ncbi:MAG: ABC transporter ATP-binding protein, partial [Pseudomonadota bacterium]|nr:ABC transporter ATP-binding protein [Pseudomonadota bacterium]
MTMLVVDGVFSGYGKSQVLHGVSLSVNEGEIVALIGANGAGKTTLLKTISGLVQAQSGTIRFQNTEIQNLSAHRIVESGVSQVAEGRAMLKRMTVLENLRIGAHVRKDKEIRQDIDQIFSKFPVLGERHDQLAGLLSGGEQQMLAIGRALMARPRILLLDEPSLGLAPMVVTEIFRTLRALRDDETTIFLVEQN